jgi:hypothetical protein
MTLVGPYDLIWAASTSTFPTVTAGTMSGWGAAADGMD